VGFTRGGFGRYFPIFSSPTGKGNLAAVVAELKCASRQDHVGFTIFFKEGHEHGRTASDGISASVTQGCELW
jgi:hypothetical protein